MRQGVLYYLFRNRYEIADVILFDEMRDILRRLHVIPLP